jgi:hypothetical protein
MRRETPLALYKGLGAVLAGIVPKMATRFASFEAYKGWLTNKETGQASVGSIFIGLFLGFCSFIQHLDIQFRLSNSRLGCRNIRSSSGCDTNGSDQNSTSSTTAFPCRPIRGAAVSKRGTCSIHYCSRRRCFCIVSGCIPHCHQTGYQPGYVFGFRICACQPPLTWMLLQA